MQLQDNRQTKNIQPPQQSIQTARISLINHQLPKQASLCHSLLYLRDALAIKQFKVDYFTLRYYHSAFHSFNYRQQHIKYNYLSDPLPITARVL